MSPADRRSPLTGRATDPAFAQNPIPVLEAMGRALAEVHRRPIPAGLQSATPGEVEAALAGLATDRPPPHPYTRVEPATIGRALRDRPNPNAELVFTHGSPVVAAVTMHDGDASFDDRGTAGLDPPERDLAIALRSVVETFAGEASVAFLDAYESAEGSTPDVALLDWYALVAAFR